MSTTDQRTGFRLPWSAESRTRDADSEAETPDGTDPSDAAADASDMSAMADPTTDADASAAANLDPLLDSGEPIDNMTWPEVDRRVRQMGRRAVDRADASLAEITASVATGAPTGAARRTNALMAGLSKAMHAAAESARVETLERLAADAAERTEAIKTAGAAESAAIKQAADDDVAGVREWSKAELARVRDETETRIAARRDALELETTAHAAKVEARIERVKRVVATFEATMADFFTTLLEESDPARVALLAEQLPEAPSLELDDELEAEFEAFEAAADLAEAADTGEVTAEFALGAAAEDVLIGETTEAETDVEDGLDPEAAAEAEAAAFAAAEDAPESEDAEADAATTALSEEALAARLAKMEDVEAENASAATTELVVTGLVSVAGIAGFKRAITRIPGVTGVGVTSGPGGEFVYSVNHGSDTDFKAAVAALPGFEARVTGESDGSLQITASDHNPDN
ncbi:MAG TPA: hypothetical protein VFC71_03055 [Candidatus Polarisedimenticolia bacterium]|nr:hypothetical protein [Candidatus Polarisedimenticolia bacterium]